MTYKAISFHLQGHLEGVPVCLMCREVSDLYTRHQASESFQSLTVDEDHSRDESKLGSSLREDESTAGVTLESGIWITGRRL